MIGEKEFKDGMNKMFEKMCISNNTNYNINDFESTMLSFNRDIEKDTFESENIKKLNKSVNEHFKKKYK